MIALLLAATLGHAAPEAHHHPDAVAQASSLFAKAQDASATPFDTVRRRNAALAAALDRWQAGLDLLGASADPDEATALEAATRAFFRDQAVVSSFANDLLLGFDAAFSAALERALVAKGGTDWAVCAPPAKPGLRMGPGPRAEETACPGTDRSPELAATMDADPVLQSELEALLARPWPTFSVADAPSPSPDGTHQLDLYAWIHGAGADALKAIAQAEEEARLSVDAALEQDPDDAQIAVLKSQVEGIEARTAAARAALALPVLDAVAFAADKLARKGVPAPSWCVRPDVYGGCSAPAMSEAHTEMLRSHGKVRKALDALD